MASKPIVGARSTNAGTRLSPTGLGRYPTNTPPRQSPAGTPNTGQVGSQQQAAWDRQHPYKPPKPAKAKKTKPRPFPTVQDQYGKPPPAQSGPQGNGYPGAGYVAGVTNNAEQDPYNWSGAPGYIPQSPFPPGANLQPRAKPGMSRAQAREISQDQETAWEDWVDAGGDPNNPFHFRPSPPNFSGDHGVPAPPVTSDHAARASTAPAPAAPRKKKK